MARTSKNIEKKEIRKSNNLIESKYKLTMSESRIIDLALTKLETIMCDKNISAEEVQKLINTSQFKEIEINVVEYKKEYNVKANNIYEELAKSTSRLQKRIISSFDVEKNKLTNRNWVITSVYNFDKCSISIQFHPDLIPDLLIFKGSYTKFDFNIKKHIKSPNADKLYEILNQYVNIGYRTFDSIEKFRFMMGIENDEYPSYANLKQKVIKPSLDQINKITDIYCEVTEKKDKNKVVGLNFKILQQRANVYDKKEKTKQISFMEADDEVAITKDTQNIPELIAEFKDLLGVTIGKKQIDKLLEVTSSVIKELELDITPKEYIKEKKVIVDNYAKTHEVPNYLGAIYKAIQGNWKLTRKPSRFNEFDQREYDYDDLEKKLLGWDK